MVSSISFHFYMKPLGHLRTGELGHVLYLVILQTFDFDRV